MIYDLQNARCDYAPKAKKIAAAIEKTANEYAQSSWERVTFSVTNSAKAILVFRLPEAVAQETDLQEETAEAVGDAASCKYAKTAGGYHSVKADKDCCKSSLFSEIYNIQTV